MPRRRATACWDLLALLPLVPLVAGALPAAPGLDASAATLTAGGVATLDLAGLVIEGPACGQAPVLAVTAARGVLEVDNETTALWVTPAVGTPRENTRESRPLAGAAADGFALHEGCRLLALPVPGSPLRATAALGAGHVGAPGASALAFEPRASFDRGRMEVAAGALPLEVAQSGTLQVQAPFLLVAWEASFRVHDAGGTRSYRTGVDAEPVAPAPAPGQRHTQREAYLLVEEGSLGVSLTPGIRPYAASLEVDVADGRLQLHDPAGTLPLRGSAIPAGSRLLELEGATVVLGPAGGRLGARLAGDPAAAYLDGVAVAPPPEPGLRAAPLLAVLGAAAVAAAVVLSARARAERRMARLEELVAGRRYDEALALARRAQARRPDREDARLAEATCLIQLSRFAEARLALGGPGWQATSRPLREYLLASAEAGLGQTSLAVKHLTDCLLEAPAFAAEALANPLLAPALRQVLEARGSPSAGESYA